MADLKKLEKLLTDGKISRREFIKRVSALMDVVNSYAIDRSRIYLTGLSLGGFGAWHLAEAYPHLFAAIIPICGGTRPMIGFPERIKVLKDTPIWACCWGRGNGPMAAIWIVTVRPTTPIWESC